MDQAWDHAPLAGLELKVTVDAAGRPGEPIRVQPAVMAGPLQMTWCGVGPRFAELGREVNAAIVLCEPGSNVLDRTTSGFL